MVISAVQGKDLALTRFDIPLSELEGLVDSRATDVSVLDTLTTKGGRNHAFALQELFRLYEEEKDTAKDWRKVAKKFEDLIGRRTDVSDWRLFLNALPIDAELMGKISAYLDRELEERTKLSLKELKELREKDALKGMRERVESWSFHSNKEDRETVLHSLQAHLKSIETKKYDLSLLEGQTGIHEFRRDIRQFLIAAHALNGLILLDEKSCPLDQYRPLLTQPIAKKDYNQLPENKDEKKPCVISQCLYLGLSKLSDDLSEAKDVGQGEEMLKRYYIAKKEGSAEQLANNLARLHKDYHDYRTRAKKLRQEMLHTELLSYVREDLKACRD